MLPTCSVQARKRHPRLAQLLIAHLTKAEGCISGEHGPRDLNSSSVQLHGIAGDETELTPPVGELSWSSQRTNEWKGHSKRVFSGVIWHSFLNFSGAVLIHTT